MLHRSVRPPIFSCFGDIALAIGENVEKYLSYAMLVLQGAAELVVLDQSNEDTIVHHNQLRHGILEAYSGILQGMKGPKAQLMLPYASHLFQFTEAVYKDPSRDESVTKAAVAALGDLADILGLISKDLFKIHPFHVELLSECLNSDSEVREIVLSSRRVITANRSRAFLIREIFFFLACDEGFFCGYICQVRLPRMNERLTYMHQC